MKQFVLLFTVLFFVCSFSNAQQISKNALGLRVEDDGGFSSLGVAISYQLGLSDNTRVESNVSFRSGDNFKAFKLVGLYQWVMPLDRSFNWYVGAGAGIGTVDPDFAGADNDTFALLAGDIGIEYQFEVPLLLSLDLRPEFGFGDEAIGDGFEIDLGIGLRYQF